MSAYKVLGQVNPPANSLTTLYTVPASISAVCSTLSVCNQAAVATTVTVAVRPAGATIDPKHYILYNAVLAANDSLFFTIGLSLATTDVVSVSAPTTTVSFNLYGTEF